jgi:hypothetical protein
MSLKDVNEENFRARCAEVCARHPDLPRLKNIAAVGVYDAGIGGPGEDSRRLTATLDYILRSGFLIDPEFIIDPVNFREGRDFLFEDKPADLVFVSYILAGAQAPYFWPKEDKPFNRDEISYTVSRRGCRGGWANHIDEIGAKMVVTYGGHMEVNAQTFGGPYHDDFAVLIPSPDEECMGRFVPASQMKPLYPTLPRIDLPWGWFGFSARRDFLMATKPSLHAKTCLGEEALKHAQPPEPKPPYKSAFTRYHL